MLSDTMAIERVRTVLVLREELRQALRLEAAKRDEQMSRIVEELLEQHLAESLAEVRRRRADEKPRGKKS
jgi:DNA-binding transcriptional regulator YdaS (Cro superfamily)